MALLRGLIWVFQTVVDRAERELNDGEAVKAQLMDLYDRLEKRTVSEAEFARREAELVKRLAEIQEYEERRKRRAFD